MAHWASTSVSRRLAPVTQGLAGPEPSPTFISLITFDAVPATGPKFVEVQGAGAQGAALRGQCSG